MKIRRFAPQDVPAIARLNERLRAGGAVDVVYPEGSEQVFRGTIRERLFVAADGDEIRGGVWLKEQDFRIGGADVRCGWLKYPVAESLVDPRFSGVPGSLLVQCLREQPRLMALGLGGHETPLARMLAKLRWDGVTVPMLVRMIHPARCLRQLAPLRWSPARAAAADLLAFSGIAFAAQRGSDALTALRTRWLRGYEAERCERFGDWVDELWTRLRDRYAFIAGRDAATLEAMQPASNDVHRLRVRRRGADVGAAQVVLHDFSRGRPDARFGTLTVGLIGDCLAAPEDAPGVIRAAFEHLRSQGADLVFSNQLHPVWVASLRQVGFILAPSNFAFYRSPALAKLGVDFALDAHVNRGDCDGPIWYGER